LSSCEDILTTIARKNRNITTTTSNMEQLMKLAQQAGMTEEQGKTAIGGIFGLLKDHLSESNYSKLSKQFPEADALAKQDKAGVTDAGTTSGGGLLGAAMGAVGGLQGAGAGGSSGNGSTTDIINLLAKLAGKGVTPQQIEKFLPVVAPYIQKMTGVDVSKLLGTPTAPSGAATTTGEGGGGAKNDAMNMINSLTGGGSGASDANKNLLGSAMGMFGK
jgi:hypothetical protein